MSRSQLISLRSGSKLLSNILEQRHLHRLLSLHQLHHLVLEEVLQVVLLVRHLLELPHVLLVLPVERLVVLHDALLQLVELVIEELGLLALRVLGVRKDDAPVARQGREDRQQHVCLVVHLGL